VEEAARRCCDAEVAHVRDAYLEIALLVLEKAPGWEPGEVRLEREAARMEVQALGSLRALGAFAEAQLARCLAPAASGAPVARRIAQVKEHIRANHQDPDLTVERIAANAGLSESYLCTVFKQACALTVKDYLLRVRLERAKELLRHGNEKLQAVAWDVGFRDANYFSTVFKREVGITPREYRERARR
jgi:two-component system response regulator YesN